MRVNIGFPVVRTDARFTKILGWVDLVSYGAPPTHGAKVELCYYTCTSTIVIVRLKEILWEEPFVTDCLKLFKNVIYMFSQG